MKKKNGFISTTIIYSFFLVFILIMIAILMSYANKAFLKEKIADNITDPGQPPEQDTWACKTGDDTLVDCLFKSEKREILSLENKIESSPHYDSSTTIAINAENNSILSDNEESLFFHNWGLRSANTIEDIKNTIHRKANYKLHGESMIFCGLDDNGDKVCAGSGKYFSNMNLPEVREVGLYEYHDDMGTTYYYRGAEDDNYVKFADKLWQIIRINGDGSIRLVYQGEWDEINSKSTKKDKLDYIKKYSFVDVDNNGTKNSNDARHYNVNNTGEAGLEYDYYIYNLNKSAIDKHCSGEEIAEGWLFNYIQTKSCDFFNNNLSTKLTEIRNYGNKDNDGSHTLYNAGFMSNGKYPIDSDDKLNNSAPSTIMNFLISWYDTNLKDKASDIEDTAVFCANKDVVLKNYETGFGLINIQLLDDQYCYCYADSKVDSWGWNNGIMKLDGAFCSDKLAVDNKGRCSDKGFIDGFQLNYHLESSLNLVKGIPDNSLKCMGKSNSSFSKNKSGTTKIEAPIGLVTAGELILAGAPYRLENDKFYLTTNFNYWTSDLAFGNNNTGYNSTYYFAFKGGDGKHLSVINDYRGVTLKENDKISAVAYIKPVINLKIGIKYQGGQGTIDEPYKIEKEES